MAKKSFQDLIKLAEKLRSKTGCPWDQEQTIVSMLKFDQVITKVHKKIVSRHTWIFGKDKAKTPQEAILMWQKNKQKERNKQKNVHAKQTLGNKKSQ